MLALGARRRCAPTRWPLSIFAIHLLGDLVSPPLIGRISDAFRDRARCTGARGLQIGMYLLPGALALSALAWFRGAARAAPRHAPRYSLSERAAACRSKATPASSSRLRDLVEELGEEAVEDLALGGGRVEAAGVEQVGVGEAAHRAS